MRCVDCKFFLRKKVRGFPKQFVGVCTMQLPWWYRVHTEVKVVEEDYGCDLGVERE